MINWLERIIEIAICVSVCSLVCYFLPERAVLPVALPLLVATSTVYILIKKRNGSNREDN